MLKSIIGVPWQMTPIPDTGMEEIPEFRVISPEGRSGEEHVDQVGSQMPRAAKLTKDIMEQYGYTPQCAGCINLRLGKYHRAHTSSCRSRVEDQLKRDAQLRWRVEAASARQTAWREREQERENPMEGAEQVVATPPLGPADNPAQGGAGGHSHPRYGYRRCRCGGD